MLALSFFLLAIGELLAQSQEPPAFWENEFKNDYNREPMLATYFAYENKELTTIKKGLSSFFYNDFYAIKKYAINWLTVPINIPA